MPNSAQAGNGRSSTTEDIKESLENLSPADRKTLLTEAVKNLNGASTKDVVTEATQTLTLDAKKDVAAEATQALSPGAKKDVVTEATQTLPPDAKKDVAVKAVQDLSLKDREEIAGHPTQRVTDRIWLIIVGTFAFVLVISAIALVVTAVLNSERSTEIMLPVFTSIAGIMAGFISGRASTSATSR
jgi:hypothetical protein